MSLHARLDGYMVRRIVKLFSKVQKSTFDAIWYADRVERVKIIPLLTYVLALICEIRDAGYSMRGRHIRTQNPDAFDADAMLFGVIKRQLTWLWSPRFETVGGGRLANRVGVRMGTEMGLILPFPGHQELARVA